MGTGGRVLEGKCIFGSILIRTNCPQLQIVVYLNSCNIHQSFWSLIALCFDLVMQKSICIFILCCLIISCFLSVLLCTLLSITPECIHVLLRLRSSSFLACHRLSRVTSLADMWSSYLPVLWRLLKCCFPSP